MVTFLSHYWEGWRNASRWRRSLPFMFAVLALVAVVFSFWGAAVFLMVFSAVLLPFSPPSASASEYLDYSSRSQRWSIALLALLAVPVSFPINVTVGDVTVPTVWICLSVVVAGEMLLLHWSLKRNKVLFRQAYMRFLDGFLGPGWVNPQSRLPRKTKEIAVALWELHEWEKVKLSSSRKICLVQLRVPPSQAFSPQIRAMTMEDIKVYCALRQ